MKNNYRIEGEIVYIEIISKGVTYETLIDKEDLERVSELGRKIGLTKGYVIYKENRKNMGLHRFILNTPKDKIVDHINTDPLDNRKINLRNVTCKDNNRNLNNNYESKSGVRGVTKKLNNKRRRPWQVQIRGVSYGCYATLEEATSVSNKVYAELREREKDVYYREA